MADEFVESRKDGELDELDEVVEATELPPELRTLFEYSRLVLVVSVVFLLPPPLEFAVTRYFIILLSRLAAQCGLNMGREGRGRRRRRGVKLEFFSSLLSLCF